MSQTSTNSLSDANFVDYRSWSAQHPDQVLPTSNNPTSFGTSAHTKNQAAAKIVFQVGNIDLAIKADSCTDLIYGQDVQGFSLLPRQAEVFHGLVNINSVIVPVIDFSFLLTGKKEIHHLNAQWSKLKHTHNLLILSVSQEQHSKKIALLVQGLPKYKHFLPTLWKNISASDFKTLNLDSSSFSAPVKDKMEYLFDSAFLNIASVASNNEYACDSKSEPQSNISNISNISNMLAQPSPIQNSIDTAAVYYSLSSTSAICDCMNLKIK